MADIYDDFPHHGEHLGTDSKQAALTFGLLIAFVLALSALAVLIGAMAT